MNSKELNKIKNLFESDYPGIDSVYNDILLPIFGNGNCEREAQVEEITSKDRMKAHRAKIQSCVKFGTITCGKRDIDLYDLTIMDNTILSNSRVGIQNYIRTSVIPGKQAFMFFHYGDCRGKEWRFSYFYNDSSKKASERNSAKRFTYLFGQNQSTRTALERFGSLSDIEDYNEQDILEAFSVEALSDEFFNDYRALYSKVQKDNGKTIGRCSYKLYKSLDDIPEAELGFCDYVERHKNDKSLFGDEFRKDDDGKAIRDYVKKFMGRLVFLQFVQKKGWMMGRHDYLNKLFDNSKYQDDFLDKELEPLFFCALNTPKDDRQTILDNHNSNPKNVKWPCNVSDYDGIPYLNGGLFDEDEMDRPRSKFPSYLFKKKDGDIYDGLLDLFARYNFTVDENGPDDMSVGIDPEMLGRIFENQLEDNKDKGAFYTPKEIVQYMCNESLIAYLTRYSVDNGNVKGHTFEYVEPFVRELITKPDTEILDKMNPRQMEKFGDALRNVKICDPAIGSGAFPMGMLNELIRCRVLIGAWAKDRDGNILVDDYAELKREIICNNIYGVDIEKGAIDIARLRFWLSIVVDETIPKPLPNFDYKFMEGNSLYATFKNHYIDLSQKNRGNIGEMRIETLKLADLKSKYYDSFGEDKYDLDIQIKQSILKMIDLQIDYLCKSWYQKNCVKQNTLFSTEDLPEISVDSIEKKLPVYLYNLRHLGDDIKDHLNRGKSKAERAHTNIHFFDWHIMFTEVFDKRRNENPGFDIVIGNPPYVRQERLGKDYKELLCEIYETVGNGTADLYVYFFGLGMSLLKKNGVLTFITLNKYLKTKYGKELRNTLAKTTAVDLIIDFFELPVFNASTDSAITKLYKTYDNDIVTRYFPIKTLENLDLMKITSGNYQKTIKNENEWQFVEDGQEEILAKINIDTIPLKEFVNEKMYLGIKTGLNKAFIIKDKNISSNLLNSESKSLMKRFAVATDIKQWEIINDSNYLLATGFDLDIPKKYPTAKAYLDNFRDELIPRGDQGKTYYNLRACAYYDEIEKTKLIYIYTAKDHQFYYDTEGHYVNNSCFMIVNDSKFLFCFLNSKLFKFYKKLKFVAYGDGQEAGRCKLDYNKMATVPIKKGVDEKPFAELVDKVFAEKKKNPDFNPKEIEKQIDELVYNLYGLTEEEKNTVDPERNGVSVPSITQETEESEEDDKEEKKKPRRIGRPRKEKTLEEPTLTDTSEDEEVSESKEIRNPRDLRYANYFENDIKQIELILSRATFEHTAEDEDMISKFRRLLNTRIQIISMKMVDHDGDEALLKQLVKETHLKNVDLAKRMIAWVKERRGK